jgi:hypothetical protein
VARSAQVSVHGRVAQAAAQGVTLVSPARQSSVIRGGALHVEGTAWDGAEVDVEVNGDVVATEIAAVSGRFAVDVPLDEGSNLVAVETHASDGSRWSRSGTFFVTAQGARRMPVRATDPLPRRGVAPRGAPFGGGNLRPR